MIKAILIISTLFVAAYSQSAAITMAFDEEWKGEDRENRVLLSWSVASNNDLVFNLVHPNIATEGIKTLIYLKNNSTGFIEAFNPPMVNTTTNGKVSQNYNQAIPFADFDSVSKFPCTRVEADNVTSVTCQGIFSIVVGSEVSNDRVKDFQLAQTKALITYEFRLITKVDKLTSSSLTTFVKTKVKGLPCTNCQCADVCEGIVGFTAATKLCSDDSCAAARANSTYIFGEEGVIEISITPNTRIFDLHQFWVQAPVDGEFFAKLDPKYIKSWNNSVPGKVILKLDMAGPANATGAEFNLKFILRARTAPSLRLRLLQTAPAQALNVEINRVNYNGAKPKIPEPPRCPNAKCSNPKPDCTCFLDRLGLSLLFLGFILISILF